VILGRPTNLIIGSFQAILGGLVVILAGLPHPIVISGLIVGAIVGIFGALIALVANQPPSLNPGDTFNTITPKGQPNYVTTVSVPPASDAAPVPNVAPAGVDSTPLPTDEPPVPPTTKP